MKTINFLALLLGVLLLPGQAFAQYNAVQEVAPKAVATMLAEGALFVDVRETNEVEVLAYDLPDLISVPLSELPDRLAELPHNRPIVVAGRSGTRSLKAAALLSENNFTQLFNLTGGIIAWEAAGLPVRKMDRMRETMPAGKKQCCASTSATEETTGKSCCAGKTGAASEKASCGEKGKAKGKSCCSGGSR
ncbi:rhodanese-like domain-containing protein [Neolewinella persica]|uniref:rhodanese-like domain-containing protein n=1 Tax=Neolewinella persica TaxID=70998 RepID=UPI00037C4A09|nr:rhodanese-like domain-containing protein [Neolewinella persica]